MSTANTKPAEFGKFRSFFWPIHNFELKKILPMLFMFFFISFNYSIMRALKDNLVQKTFGSPGAEIIPYLKVFAVVPMAFLIMFLYSKASNALNKKNLFYVSLLPFAVFFLIFKFVLFPLQDILHPVNLNLAIITDIKLWGFIAAIIGIAYLITRFKKITNKKLFYILVASTIAIYSYFVLDTSMLQKTALPEGFTAMFRIWTCSLFYCFAELWGSVALSLLFWGFANDTTKVEESKRFYALFGIGANIALTAAGGALKFFKATGDANASQYDQFGYIINSSTTLFMLSVAAIVALYWWVNKYVLTDPRFFEASKVKKKKKKASMSLGESFKYLAKSKYMRYLAILVISYGVSINLIEVVWKNIANTVYSDPAAYNNFMGNYFIVLSIMTIFMMLFVSSNLIRKFGWKFSAMVTPVTILITGIIFFGLVVFKDNLTPLFDSLGIQVLTLAMIVGTLQNAISKAAKYSLFDPTKEMVYIPLDDETKVKGKAAVDVVAARLGKAGGAVSLIAIFNLIGGLAQSAFTVPTIGIISTIILLMWINSVSKLDKEMRKLSTEKEEIKAEAVPA